MIHSLKSWHSLVSCNVSVLEVMNWNNEGKKCSKRLRKTTTHMKHKYLMWSTWSFCMQSFKLPTWDKTWLQSWCWAPTKSSSSWGKIDFKKKISSKVECFVRKTNISVIFENSLYWFFFLNKKLFFLFKINIYFFLIFNVICKNVNYFRQTDNCSASPDWWCCLFLPKINLFPPNCANLLRLNRKFFYSTSSLKKRR